MTLAESIVVMDHGVVQQVGKPLDVYRNPANLFVAGFIGTPAMNFFDVTVAVQDGGALLEGRGFAIPLPEPLRGRAGEPGRPLVLGIRPEHLSGAKGPDRAIRAQVSVVEQLGPDVHAICEVAGQPLTARLEPDTTGRVGGTVELAVDTAALHLFDKQSGASLSGEN